jgi:hypothetical protein
MIHIFANIAHIILYSGYVVPVPSNPILSYFSYFK